MMESGKDNGARWGNKIGYMLIPFHLARHDDPVEYVRRATKVARRKKSSMESVFTFWSGYMVLKLFGIKVWIRLLSLTRRLYFGCELLPCDGGENRPLFVAVHCSALE
jgi:hypothetical protein